jgi:mannose/fructose/N-acetylgalactosamine-specific phosphotransferase system component IID
MGMSKAITPDIGAFFGRPVSQGPGLSVLSAGQQQAMYGTTPQAVNPDAGVNLAMAQAKNQTALDAAAMSATGQAKAGMMSGFGNILGSVLPGMPMFGG